MVRHTAASWSFALGVLVGCSAQMSTVDGGSGTTGGGSSTSGITGGTSTGGTGRLAAGAPCTGNGQCLSDVCGVFGSGHCCATQCMAAIESACNPTGCDATSGACTYPVGTACGTPSCSGDMLTEGACDATGACKAATSACANSLLCNPGGTACLTTCNASSDCIAGAYCNAGACAPKQATGTCTENDDCTSGVCGVPGQGTLQYCCSEVCSTTDPICGATGCSPTGACVYPDMTVTCGLPQACVGSTQTNATQCDNSGHCPAPTTIDCSPYICSVLSPVCLTGCQGNNNCSVGGFCDTEYSACCPLTTNGYISVDSVTGDDDAGCCGVGSNPPCQTILKAMRLIDVASVTDVTINATVDGDGGQWAAVGEDYPIVLGWGAELSAPGVSFAPRNSVEVFSIDATPFSTNDTALYASIVGSATRPVGIIASYFNDGIGVSVSARNTLYIANATVDGTPDSSAIAVYGSLRLGQDQSSITTGTVIIGEFTAGNFGIYCQGAVGSPATIQDAALVGQSSVTIRNQASIDLYAVDYCDISLTSNPVIGMAAPCAVLESTGIYLAGAATGVFDNATLQCIGNLGIDLDPSPAGVPEVTIDNAVIRNVEFGIAATAGTVTVTRSTIINSLIGVWQQDSSPGVSGSIDLSGGGNTVVCSSALHDYLQTGWPGIDVYNESSVALNASNVAWDTGGPDYFACDSAFASCTCNLGSCTVDAGGDGMDAVEDSTALGGITTTGNTLSPLALDAGCR